MNPEKWRYIFDAIKDPMFLHDAQFRVLLANRAYFREAGMTEAEVLGKPYWEVFPPGSGPLPGCKQGLDEGLDESQEEVSVGEKIFVFKRHSVRNDQGNVIHALHVFSDITERKKKEDRVLLLSHRLQQLVESIQKLALARDMETIIGVACSAARGLIGSDGSTFVLREGDQCFYADENAIHPLWKGQRFPMSTCISGWVMINHQPAAIKDIYTDARIPASAYRPTFVKSLAMVPIRRQNPLGAIGNYWAPPYLPTQEEMQLLQTLADATGIAMENVRLFDEQEQRLAERKEVEALLRNSEKRYRQIIQTSMDGIWIVDTVGRILEVNDAYCRMSGYSRDELLAMRIPDVEANERTEDTARHIQEIMTKGCDRFETRHRRKDGQLLEIEVSVVYRPYQKDGCFFGFLRDITARKRAEKELHAAMYALTVAEERERRGIGIDLHDGPCQLLAAANLKLSGLQRETDKAVIVNAMQEARELIERAQRSLRSLIFQASPPVLFELGLVPALSWLAEEVRRIYGITVSVHDDDNPKSLDPTARSLVFRVARELVINVAKHAKVKTADVDVHCVNGQLIVSVTDYGIGFDPNNIGNTSSEGGFGLLSIRERLGFVGGEIEIDSAPGDGTVATLSVPIAP